MKVSNASGEPRAPRPDLQKIRQAAYLMIGKGHTPLPLPGGQKRPLLNNWQTVAVTVNDVEKLFTDGDNIGLRLDKLTDVDPDCAEARALAPFFLEPTSARWGRKTAPRSHHLYSVKNSRSEEFTDPLITDRKQMIVEIRHDNGHQSMIPPSVHPNGELLAWDGDFQPKEWNFYSLRRAVGKIAAGALLMRYLKPDSGVRHYVWFYLGGAMARAEWKKEEALHFVACIAQAAGDEQSDDRRRAVESSYEEGKEELAGLKKLDEYLPKPVVSKLAQWLDLRHARFDPLDLTDDSNAQSIFTEHGEDLRYLPNEGTGGLWVYWNDVIWQRDRSDRANHVAAGTLKKKADQLTATSRDARFIEKVRRELLNVPGVTAALDRLSWYPDISTPSSVFDANAWLVGLQNGIYNLQLDRLQEGVRENLV